MDCNDIEKKCDDVAIIIPKYNRSNLKSMKISNFFYLARWTTIYSSTYVH